jgi:hypothetical protein
VNSTQISEQTSGVINQRNAETVQAINQISSRKQEALANLETQMKVTDTVGDAGATVTIIFITLFVVCIVLCDLLKLLSFLKIIKPIKMLSSIERYKHIRGGMFMRANKDHQTRRISDQYVVQNPNEFDVNGRRGYRGIYSDIRGRNYQIKGHDATKLPKAGSNQLRRSFKSDTLRLQRQMDIDTPQTLESSVSEFLKHQIKAKPNLAGKRLKPLKFDIANENSSVPKIFGPDVFGRHTSISSRSSSSAFNLSSIQS